MYFHNIKANQYDSYVGHGCRTKSYAEYFEDYIMEKLNEKGCEPKCWLWSMPNLSLCNINKTKDMECAKSVMAKYNATSFLQDVNANWNHLKPCSITEYSGKTLLYGPMTDFMRDVGMIDKNHVVKDKLAMGEGFSVLTYEFAIPEQISIYKEEIVFDEIQLIGNLGGIFGLFTGFSFFGSVGWIIRMITKCWHCMKKN